MVDWFWQMTVFTGGVLGAVIGFVVLAAVFLMLAAPFVLMYRSSQNPAKNKTSLNLRNRRRSEA